MAALWISSSQCCHNKIYRTIYFLSNEKLRCADIDINVLSLVRLKIIKQKENEPKTVVFEKP